FFASDVKAKSLSANKTKGYSSRYINDFNASQSFEPIYDYDNTRTEVEKVSYRQDASRIDDNLDLIYPDPEDFHRRMLNKTRMVNQHNDDTVIKIYTTRIRQPKKDKIRRINHTQSVDLNNDDLNSHDFIDSIMFIYYYGKNVKTWKDLGGNIVILGAGFSIFAQILTIILVTLRNRRMRKNNAFFPITMNLLVMLFLSNLLFIVGVQSNKNALRCEMIALLLHYLYLTTSVWCFVFIFIIYDLIINESLRLKMRFILLMAYAGPLIFVMFSYAASSNSLEFQKYCFMSIHKNMIINFLVPVFILIVATTIFGTICLKHIKDKNRDILCGSIDSTSNAIANGIIMNNGQNIDKFITDKEILASYYLKTSAFNNQLKCCEDQVCKYKHSKTYLFFMSSLFLFLTFVVFFCFDTQHEDNYFKSKTDIYDSKFDLGQLSLADLSDSSSTNSSSHDYTNFKNATKFALLFQPVFAICWFIGVLALENIQSYVFPTVFAICYNILLFLNTNNESSIVFTGSGVLNHRNDQIPLLYQTQFNHRKSIANLELTHSEYHFEKHKINSRSEHDLVYQQKQQQFGTLLANGKIDNLMKCAPGIRCSWDTNIDRVSTISN
ncbi:CLUMA_CG006584, isoform A, partial [Clunio marinus]